ncbi:MAG: hypothetical protein IPO92_00510 [Saprospiraceae bacterium]|nr:hypothetical protein [Saprospiraceae bacterium]
MVYSNVSCGKKNKSSLLNMTNDELVKAMVDMYCVNAALNISDTQSRDSIKQIYYAQLNQITGKSIEDIRTDFDKLLLMPDTLVMLQNRALDTLRLMQDRSMTMPTPVSLGIN